MSQKLSPELIQAFQNAGSNSRKAVRESVFLRNSVKTAELEKDAFLAKLLSLVAQGSRGAPHAYRHPEFRAAMKGVALEQFEDRVREQVARKVGPLAIRAAEVPLKGVDKLVAEVTGKGMSPEMRKKLLGFAANHPASVLGFAAGSVVPFPMASEVGIGLAGGVSAASKKILRIPTRGDAAMDEFAKTLRRRGYKDVQDYLVKTRAVRTPLTPDDIATMRAQFSPSSSFS